MHTLVKLYCTGKKLECLKKKPSGSGIMVPDSRSFRIYIPFKRCHFNLMTKTH